MTSSFVMQQVAANKYEVHGSLLRATIIVAMDELSKFIAQYKGCSEKISLNLKNVTTIDTIGAAFVLHAWQQAQKHHIQLSFDNLPSTLTRLFKLSHLRPDFSS